MTTRRRAEGWRTRLQRRIVTVPRVILALFAALVLSPVLFAGAALFDLLTRRLDFPTVRIGAGAIVFLFHELIGITVAALLWVGGLGRPSYAGSHRMQAWLVESLFGWSERLMDVQLDYQDLSTIPEGDIIVLSRHASMLDALVPADLFTKALDRPVHYVLKRELMASPIFDIYGHRLDNHFVARGGDTDREVAAIEALADDAHEGSALVIFPEGTYATDANRERVRDSLRRRGDHETLVLAESLTTLLPPKPAGALALLRRRPNATIMVLGHVGLEGVAEFSGLRANVPVRHPIVVRWWNVTVASLPPDDAGREDWLREQWRRLDRWVADQRSMRT